MVVLAKLSHIIGGWPNVQTKKGLTPFYRSVRMSRKDKCRVLKTTYNTFAKVVSMFTQQVNIDQNAFVNRKKKKTISKRYCNYTPWK